MIEHLLKHACVPVQRHGLETVCEVTIVARGSYRNACSYSSVEFGGIEVPLLARVVAEELLIELAAHFADHNIFGGNDLFARFRERFEEALYLLTGEIEAEELVQCVHVDGHGHKLPVHAGLHTMFVRTP